MIKKSISTKLSSINRSIKEEFKFPKVIKTENYTLNILLSKKKLKIGGFERIGVNNIKDVFKLYNKVISIAKNKKLYFIYTKTWIFEENKNFAKKLKFILVKGTGNNFFKALKKYPTYKIVKLDLHSFLQRMYLKKGKSIVSVNLLKNSLLLYVKKIDYYGL
jgi:hypothetical protein